MPAGAALAQWFAVELTDYKVTTFTGCSGLEATREILEWQEGGDNGTVVRLPGRLSYGNVVLTRVVDADSGGIAKWFTDQQARPARKHVAISVYHGAQPGGELVARWTLQQAWPVKYSGPVLSSGPQGDAMAIETLELSHQGFDQA
jgi:phage tail-like protein